MYAIVYMVSATAPAGEITACKKVSLADHHVVACHTGVNTCAETCHASANNYNLCHKAPQIQIFWDNYTLIFQKSQQTELLTVNK
jgi:hypothetical protein